MVLFSYIYSLRNKLYATRANFDPHNKAYILLEYIYKYSDDMPTFSSQTTPKYGIKFKNHDIINMFEKDFIITILSLNIDSMLR